MKDTCCVAGVRPIRVVLAKAITLLPFLISVLLASSVFAQEDTMPPALKRKPTDDDSSEVFRGFVPG
jgi:hypothetical protein